jgi:hypothetical protein
MEKTPARSLASRSPSGVPGQDVDPSTNQTSFLKIWASLALKLRVLALVEGNAGLLGVFRKLIQGCILSYSLRFPRQKPLFRLQKPKPRSFAAARASSHSRCSCAMSSAPDPPQKAERSLKLLRARGELPLLLVEVQGRANVLGLNDTNLANRVPSFLFIRVTSLQGILRNRKISFTKTVGAEIGKNSSEFVTAKLRTKIRKTRKLPAVTPICSLWMILTKLESTLGTTSVSTTDSGSPTNDGWLNKRFVFLRRLSFQTVKRAQLLLRARSPAAFDICPFTPIRFSEVFFVETITRGTSQKKCANSSTPESSTQFSFE